MSQLRVLVRLPDWIGDAVMCTPALDILGRQLPAARVTVVGPPGVTQLFCGDPRFSAVVADPTKRQSFRWLRLTLLARQVAAEHGPFDLAFTFKNSLAARWFLLSAGARRRTGAQCSWTDRLLTDVIPCPPDQHFVEWCARIVTAFFGVEDKAGPLTLHVPERSWFLRATAGIAPGSAFGSVRRWEPRRFGQLAAALASQFDIVLLGGPKERPLGEAIESVLHESGVTNFRNAIGQPMPEMMSTMAGLSLFVGNDSGAAHIATALGVPTVVIVGPTSPTLTAPWRHAAARVVQHAVSCAPCKHRVCPLEGHPCLSEISVRDVLEAAYSAVSGGRRRMAG